MSKEYSLYLLLEEKENIVGAYLNSLGVYPVKISKSIQETNTSIMFDDGNVLLLIVDSGKSSLTHTSARKGMIDLVGMFEADEAKEVIVIHSSEEFAKVILTSTKLSKKNVIKYNGSKTIPEVLIRTGKGFKKGQEITLREANKDLYASKQMRETEDYVDNAMRTNASDIINRVNKFKNSEDSEQDLLEMFKTVV